MTGVFRCPECRGWFGYARVIVDGVPAKNQHISPPQASEVEARIQTGIVAGVVRDSMRLCGLGDVKLVWDGANAEAVN